MENSLPAERESLWNVYFVAEDGRVWRLVVPPSSSTLAWRWVADHA